MILPSSLRKLIDSFERLPGIGPKTAQRLALYSLNVPQEQLDEFSQSLSELKIKTLLCTLCYNVTEEDPCPVCRSLTRDREIICVVEHPLDVLAIEKSGYFKGLYHVLHGAISPLNNIGIDDLYVAPLFKRIKNSDPQVKEVILATNPNMEGEATAMYLAKQIKSIDKEIKVTRLGQGLPTGGDLEYADELTLRQALLGRRTY